MHFEQVNTAIEAVVDLVTEEHKELARLAKDTAAGAVLVAAITAAIVGGLIFFPKLAQLLDYKFNTSRKAGNSMDLR